MKQSIIYKTLLILGFVIIAIFLSSGYLFYVKDNELITQIRNYNLDQTMSALDAQQEIQLENNKAAMAQNADMIAKNSSIFLLNFDKEGLKKSLSFDIQKKSLKAIKIIDSVMNETFLIVYKKGNTLVYDQQFPENFKDFPTLKRPIYLIQDDSRDKIGQIIIHYDESIIKNQIKRLKEETKNKISKFNTTIDDKMHNTNLVKLSIAAASLVTILILISILLIKLVNKPLKILKNGLDEFFLFLQNKKDHASKIDINSKDEFGQMSKGLNENIAVSAKLHEEIHELNTNLEKKVEEKTKKVTTLLDNAGQGFLTFDKNFTVDHEYSKECEKLLGKDLAGKDISSLLFEEKNKIEIFKTSLVNAQNETMPVKRNSYISLLPSVILLNKKALKLEYKILEEGNFMMIITNITSQKKLERKIKREQEILKMIVSVVSESEVFYELKKEYTAFLNSYGKLIDTSKTPLFNITALYRSVHTFKGTFSQLYMQDVVSFLHNLESEISSMQKGTNYTNKDIVKLLDSFDFNDSLNKSLEIIKEVLGDDFLESENYLKVDLCDIKTLQSKIETVLDNHNETTPECKDILSRVQKLSSSKLYAQLQPYVSLSMQLAQRLGKEIYEFNIIGDKNLVVGDSLKPFIKSLVHLFRNSVDHGIETPEERVGKNKDETGSISCSFDIKDRHLYITVSDDGAGIDLEKIKNKLILKGLDPEQYKKEELYLFLFEDSFSTKEELSDISGRGIGMGAVKEELDKLNGIINITSQIDVGTTFEFIIPL